jgi:hypothetical protein
VNGTDCLKPFCLERYGHIALYGVDIPYFYMVGAGCQEAFAVICEIHCSDYIAFDWCGH